MSCKDKITVTSPLLPDLKEFTSYNGVSVLDYGDLSAFSFHATKVYSTVE